MAGRMHLSRHDEPRLPPHRLPHSSSSTIACAFPIATLEKRIHSHNCEIQSLLVDNQRLAATHVFLKQDLSLTNKTSVASPPMSLPRMSRLTVTPRFTAST
ncbi:hypothetical protein RIF29_23758 [Crotalaria pallida]|uniref:Uncharacterized protein n=1 Tax=Crotalaria pallida TaxID=3830 RepID=A0AAN9F6F9_CROPI